MKSPEKEEINSFKTIVENIKTGFLFTRLGVGEVKGRPMTTVHIGNSGDCWFFSSEFSSSVSEICRNNDVFLNYANPFINTYAVVTGKAYLTREINKMNELYTPSIKTWFPAGLNDPNLLLIRIEPDEITYWNGNSGKIVSSFKLFSGMSSDDEFINGKGSKPHLNYL